MHHDTLCHLRDCASAKGGHLLKIDFENGGSRERESEKLSSPAQPFWNAAGLGAR